MRLRVRPMALHDVEVCVALLAARPEEQRRYGELLQELAGAWRKLIPAGALNARVVEEMDAAEPQVAAFGVSVFVREDVLRQLKTAPLVWIGPELVWRAHASDGAILSPKEIRDANSGAGLSLVVWAGLVSAPPPNERIHTELWKAFFEAHVGYHISELICQPLDPLQAHATIQAGLSMLSGDGQYVDDARSEPWEKLTENAFILGGDRQLVAKHFGCWLSALFTYTPPRIHFRPAEQRLLLAALSGLTDEELSNALGVSHSAVKKTWCVVYDRAAAALPDEFLDKMDDKPETRRGKQKKQRLLAYLRDHMEELRPVLPPRNKAGRPFISATDWSRTRLEAICK
jgi:hypothetical protein